MAAWDNYPSPKDDPSFPAMKHDIMRAMKDGESYVIAEQSPNQQNWQPYNKVKRPGEVRTIAFQGLDMVPTHACFFKCVNQLGARKVSRSNDIACR